MSRGPASRGRAYPPGEEARLRHWEHATDWPITIVAIIFLAVYSWPILDQHLAHPIKRTCEIIAYGAWAAFGVDYLVRLVLAERRARFFWRHLLDLASIALPVLRPLRLLRLVAFVRVLNRRATASVRGQVFVYVTISIALIIYVAALAGLDAERNKPGSNINTFPDALWWATTTVTTVGYGDHYPRTAEGRLVAVGLMMAGITLLGVVTASVATWLIAQIQKAESTSEANVISEIDELRAEIAALRTVLARLDPVGADPAPSPRDQGGIVAS